MNTPFRTWLTEATNNATNAEIAHKTGIAKSTVGRWEGAPPRPETIVQVARAFKANAVDGLVAAGYLHDDEVRIPKVIHKPADFTSLELLDELRTRVLNGRVEMSHPLETVTPPRPEHFDLAAMSGMSEGERLRNAMNAEQETPESFYDGGEPA